MAEQTLWLLCEGQVHLVALQAKWASLTTFTGQLFRVSPPPPPYNLPALQPAPGRPHG